MRMASLGLVVAACGSPAATFDATSPTDATADASLDARADAAPDAQVDAAVDATPDAIPDATPDASVDAMTCGPSCRDACPTQTITADGACLRCASGVTCAMEPPCTWCDPGATLVCSAPGNCLCTIPTGAVFACYGPP